jgi:hypothetical protein
MEDIWDEIAKLPFDKSKVDAVAKLVTRPIIEPPSIPLGLPWEVDNGYQT